MQPNESSKHIEGSDPSSVDESLRNMAEDDPNGDAGWPAPDAGPSDIEIAAAARDEKYIRDTAELAREKEEAIERARNGEGGLRSVAKAQTADEAIDSERSGEPDLVKRARAIKALDGFRYDVTEQKPAGGMIVTKAVSCDQNRMKAFSVLFGEDPARGRPHIDTFRGRFVDHVGKIVDERYSMEPLIVALNKAGLQGEGITAVRNAFKEWAMKVQQNDLIVKFEKKVPEWDGVERIEAHLINMFKSFDTPMNRTISRYFWLSVYNRVMTPGCLAPIVLSLFGAQNAGKSRFSNEICRAVMGDKDATSVQLDLSSNALEFLREITGNSVVANIGEMTGFNRGDLNKIKDFVTRTSDKMHYKYEGHFEQLRQWVSVLDGNKYEGLQRDDTGNRRFYPMFLGQLPDMDGKPHWQDGFEIDFDGFADTFWQLMAECRAWMNDHGMEAYGKFVRATAKRVFEFSAEEMANGRGTPRDPIMEAYFPKALGEIELKWRRDGIGTVDGVKGAAVKGGFPIYVDDMTILMEKLSGRSRLSIDSVRRGLEILCRQCGGTEARLTRGRRAFVFRAPSGAAGQGAEDEVRAFITGDEYDEF